jgi:hypothetical protein
VLLWRPLSLIVRSKYTHSLAHRFALDLKRIADAHTNKLSAPLVEHLRQPLYSGANAR